MNEPPPPYPSPPFWRTWYWENKARHRPDRRDVPQTAIKAVVSNPYRRATQEDGRFQLWGMDSATQRWLRVIVLDDGEIVRNAMYDRSFKP